MRQAAGKQTADRSGVEQQLACTLLLSRSVSPSLSPQVADALAGHIAIPVACPVGCAGGGANNTIGTLHPSAVRDLLPEEDYERLSRLHQVRNPLSQGFGVQR